MGDGALAVRDRGCRFPGCGLRFTDAHHIVPWADGGATSLENTLLLCRRHHRLVHEEGWTVEWWGKTRAVFTDPRGVDPGPREAGARWQREEDIPDPILFAALEAALVAILAGPQSVLGECGEISVLSRTEAGSGS